MSPVPLRVLIALAAGLAAALAVSAPAGARLADGGRAAPGAAPREPQGLPARPFLGDDARVDCTPNVCVHWAISGRHAPPTADADGDGIPDYVELVERTAEEAWAREVVELGYRPPVPDLGPPDQGPDARLDIYLRDIGGGGYFGLTSSDDPRAREGARDISAFLTLDDDYAAEQYAPYTSTPPEQILQVTLAHEFFHALQFGYDVDEDLWFVEGSAVWMEDEVYDEIDDHRIFLARSALTRPDVSLDRPASKDPEPVGGFEYGSFVFWRYLSEHFGSDLVHRVWELADAAPGGADLYSLAALDAALAERGTTVAEAFARFAAGNAAPAVTYEEGAAYPAPPFARQKQLGTSRPSSSGEARLDHLASWYASFRPAKGLQRTARLRVTLTLPPLDRGSAAWLAVFSRSGAVTFRRVTLDRRGDGARTVPFDPKRVAQVVLVLANGSSRYACNRGTFLSCQGTPLDDGLRFRYGVRLVP
jgi:hypothetical protein